MSLSTNQDKALSAALHGNLKRSGSVPKNFRTYIDRGSRRPDTVAKGTVDSLVDAKLIESLPKEVDPYAPDPAYTITEKGKRQAR